jgi:proline iminopeptidase
MAYQDPFLNDSGFLSVAGHKVYWEDWGNKSAKPFFHLHGGPGASFSDKHKMLYNPERHRVIFHDQRGCGRSTPAGLLDNNTTQDLISDIERLRELCGAEKISLAGGSWGATLALLYALAHPQRVEKIVIWSVFLATQFEIDWVNEGYPRYTFPEAWERFIAMVPPAKRSSGDSIMKFYAEKIFSIDSALAEKYAAEWGLWELSLCSLHYDQRRIEAEVLGSEGSLHSSRIQLHYLQEKCFVPENYILDTISRITHIPCFLVHGRFDMCCPPTSGVALAKVYGKQLTLQWVNSGHSRNDPEMMSALRATLR